MADRMAEEARVPAGEAAGWSGDRAGNRAGGGAGDGGAPALVGALDGGGTRSRYLLSDVKGRVLAEGEGGAVHFPGRDPVADEAEALAETLFAIFEIATAELELLLPLHGLCAAVAGAGRVEEQVALEGALARRGVARKSRVVSDLEAALHDAFGRGPGIVLLAGTGSVGVGRDRRGRLHRVGGWGALLGDEGSGYEIGLRGLRATIRGEEGRAPATRLGPPLMGALGLNRLDELIGWSRGVRKAEIAALAPIVLEAAENGDEVAAAVVDQAVEGLLAHVAALSRMLATEPGERGVDVALGGGLLDPGGPMRDRVAAGLTSRGLAIESRSVDGARGALGLAMELLGDQD